MQFVRALPCPLQHILGADPDLGPVLLSKFNLSDMYMRVWVRPEDAPRLDLIIPPHPSNTHTLIGFHLSLPMGYTDCAPYFSVPARPPPISPTTSGGPVHPHLPTASMR